MSSMPDGRAAHHPLLSWSGPRGTEAGDDRRAGPPRSEESPTWQIVCCRLDCFHPSPAGPCHQRPAPSPCLRVPAHSSEGAPLPIQNLRQVLAVLVDVLLVLDQLVLELPLHVEALVAGL